MAGEYEPWLTFFKGKLCHSVSFLTAHYYKHVFVNFIVFVFLQKMSQMNRQLWRSLQKRPFQPTQQMKKGWYI